MSYDYELDELDELADEELEELDEFVEPDALTAWLVMPQTLKNTVAVAATSATRSAVLAPLFRVARGDRRAGALATRRGQRHIAHRLRHAAEDVARRALAPGERAALITARLAGELA